VSVLHRELHTVWRDRRIRITARVPSRDRAQIIFFSETVDRWDGKQLTWGEQ